MRPNYCLTIFQLSILARLSAGEDSKCEVQIKVRRHTVYNVFHGQDLTVTCPVALCNSSPPTVSWYKMEKTDILVSANSSSHIKVEWEDLGHLDGQSLLIFKKIHRSDSGVYRCGTERQVSHNINVSVNGHVETTTVSWTTLANPKPPNTLWPFVFRAFGIKLFFVVIITLHLCLKTKQKCKGACRLDKCRNTSDPSQQLSHGASHSIHIYDNDL
ncbi:uncharacterized protein LOC113127196 isoform X2 [Mastacembelus armatus]|uniref:uncharacterized protein LOC113127196 isoform X2 n=1 Tax=Mastacembelus armatus TaxID=205130 RepID=UPI000E457241|nr:uncharacterized protein LOC113127196 isoform X2 [Mastacembelus armatus]